MASVWLHWQWPSTSVLTHIAWWFVEVTSPDSVGRERGVAQPCVEVNESEVGVRWVVNVVHVYQVRVHPECNGSDEKLRARGNCLTAVGIILALTRRRERGRV